MVHELLVGVCGVEVPGKGGSPRGGPLPCPPSPPSVLMPLPPIPGNFDTVASHEGSSTVTSFPPLSGEGGRDRVEGV